MEKSNLDYILFSIEQTKASIEFGFTLNESRRNLYTALHQYWQNKEMRMHSTSHREKIPKSRAAKKAKDKCQVEHVVPLKVIVDLLLELKNPTKHKVGSLLKKYYRVKLVTKEEHQRLSALGLRSKMPENWDRSDPCARYKVANIVC